MKDDWQYGPDFVRIDKANAEIVVGSGYDANSSAGTCPLAEFLEDYCDYRGQIITNFNQETLQEVVTSVHELLSQSGCRCSDNLSEPSQNDKLIELDKSSTSSQGIERTVIQYSCRVCGCKWQYTIDMAVNGETKKHFEMLKGCWKGCINIYKRP